MTLSDYALQAPTGPLLEALSTAVVLLNGSLQLIYLNPAAENLFAVSRKQVLGLYWPQIMHTDPAFSERLGDTDTSRPLEPFTERELELQTPHGQRMTVDCTATPYGKGDLLLEIARVDRHLRIAQEEHLFAQQHAARALMRGMAHEIKNPLGGLRGAAQLLEAELDQPGLKEYTQVIIGEADRLSNLVDRMLGPNNIPENRRINIHEVLDHVCSLVDAEHYPKLVVKREFDPSIPDLTADSELLVQAVLNLVRNAAQAGATTIVLRSRIQRQLTIGSQCHKLAIRIDICDDGQGVPGDIQSKIFYPMVTGRAEGTGLGLPIAQSLINRHGGIIEFNSEPGATIFTILLPLEIAND